MSYGVAITLGFSLVIYVVIRAILLGHWRLCVLGVTEKA
jgi:hypothetical protein